MKSSRGVLKSAGWIFAIALALVLMARPAAAVNTFASGDVIISIGDGKWDWFSGGVLVQTMDDATAVAITTGGAFDTGGNFLGTDHHVIGDVHKFDTNGLNPTQVGVVGDYAFNPESILFGCDGSIFVGEADRKDQPGATVGNIVKLDSTGALLNTFTVAVENFGADWIELDEDQCTMYYTSEGVKIKRFDVCTNTQLADLTSGGLLGGSAYAIRKIHGGAYNGQFIVADSANVKRIDAGGTTVLQSYNDSGLTGQLAWYGISIAPDGTPSGRRNTCIKRSIISTSQPEPSVGIRLSIRASFRPAERSSRSELYSPARPARQSAGSR